jgi:hypothetical protein
MTAQPKERERRRVPRISVDFPVVVNWGKKKFRWLAREFSEYGILLSSSEKDMVGKELKLELSLEPDTQPINVEGVVAYETKTGGLGIRFRNIAPEDQFSLKRYVRSKGIGINRK